MKMSEICQAVADDKSKLADESESHCTSQEEEILEAPDARRSMNSSSGFAT
jgi:hypothetical protein